MPMMLKSLSLKALGYSKIEATIVLVSPVLAGLHLPILFRLISLSMPSKSKKTVLKKLSRKAYRIIKVVL